jgi:hypothetical protein
MHADLEGGSHIIDVPKMTKGVPVSSHGARRPQLSAGEKMRRRFNMPASDQRATNGPLRAFHQPMKMPTAPMEAAGAPKYTM